MVDVAALFSAAKAGSSSAADVSALLQMAGKSGGNNTSSGSSAESVARLEEAVLKAAKAGDIKALVRAIKDGSGKISLDRAVGFDGNTPLHWAVEKGHVECVRALCEHGAKVDSRERWSSWTPLMLAASKDRREEAGVLIAHGASPTYSAKGAAASDLATSDEMRAILKCSVAVDTHAAPASSAIAMRKMQGQKRSRSEQPAPRASSQKPGPTLRPRGAARGQGA